MDFSMLEIYVFFTIGSAALLLILLGSFISAIGNPLLGFILDDDRFTIGFNIWMDRKRPLGFDHEGFWWGVFGVCIVAFVAAVTSHIFAQEGGEFDPINFIFTKTILLAASVYAGMVLLRLIARLVKTTNKLSKLAHQHDDPRDYTPAEVDEVVVINGKRLRKMAEGSWIEE